MLLSDGAFTPAISVLSAVSGIAIYAETLLPYVVPITIVILIILFLCQRLGTHRIGSAFGPVMVVWFGVLFSIGVWRTWQQPRAFQALNPVLGFQFLFRDNVHLQNETYFDSASNSTLIREVSTTTSNYHVLGAVFLAATGLETLYADVGHFTAWPVRAAWVGVVMPALMLQYLGTI